jgi:integrase
MGSIYRRKVRFCTTCNLRLDTVAARKACEAADHPIGIRELPTWWIKYSVGGRPQCVSSGSEKKEDAKKLLREREHLVDKGAPITAAVGKITFDEAATDLVNDYVVNGKKSLKDVRHRIDKHLMPFFGGRRLTVIGTATARQFAVHRQQAGASNAEINRELMLLKRMFNLAVQAGKLVSKPYVPMLKEGNVRQGFFEPEQFENVKKHLPTQMQGIIEFAYITGWRTPSEILPLEWRQVDMKAGEVRLDAGTTKNGEGRVFPFTTELRRVLNDQLRIADSLKAQGIVPRFVFCYTTGARGGKQITTSWFHKAWRHASREAGCPGRIPHDLRRTAVRNLVRAGVPERVAMQLTGHKTRAVFERYNITSPGDLRDAARRLDAFSAAM